MIICSWWLGVVNIWFNEFRCIWCFDQNFGKLSTSELNMWAHRLSTTPRRLPDIPVVPNQLLTCTGHLSPCLISRPHLPPSRWSAHVDCISHVDLFSRPCVPPRIPQVCYTPARSRTNHLGDIAIYAVVKTHTNVGKKNYNSELIITQIWNQV